MKQLYLYLSLLIVLGAQAQEKWAFEVRPTLHFPSEKVLGESLRIGNGIELTVIRGLGKRTSFYAGLIWNRFDTDQSFQEDDIEFIQKGVMLGGMLHFKLSKQQKNPFYARIGVTIMDVKVESVQPEFNFKTDIAFGTHLGFGVRITAFEKLYILPELRFNNSSHRFERNERNSNIIFKNVSITVGLRKAL